MGNDVSRAANGTNPRRPRLAVARTTAAVLALGLAGALTVLYYGGTAYGAPDPQCADPVFARENLELCAADPSQVTVTSFVFDTTTVFQPITETVTDTVFDTTTQTVTTTEVAPVPAPVTETVTDPDGSSPAVPVTETVTRTEVSSVLVPTTETVSASANATVTAPAVSTSVAEVVRNLQIFTQGPPETVRTTTTDRITERVTDSVAPIWWNAPSINPQTGQRPGVSLSATQVRPGDSLIVRGMGGTPGEQVRIVLHSDPVLVGTATVDTNGSFETTVVIPPDTVPGQHTIDVVGVSCGVTTSVPLTVVSGPRAVDVAQPGDAVRPLSQYGTLSYTGVDATFALILGSALVGVGGALSLVFRRRPAAGRHRF